MPELSPGAGQQPHDDRRAPADEGTCPVEEPERRKAVRVVHATGNLPQQAGIVLVEAKPAIAAAAQKAADVASRAGIETINTQFSRIRSYKRFAL